MRCDACRNPIAPHAHYVIRIEIFADPSTPPLQTDHIHPLTEGGNPELAELIAQLQHTSADELQDQIHRRFQFALCPSCQQKFLANPLGLPRQSNQPSQN